MPLKFSKGTGRDPSDKQKIAGQRNFALFLMMGMAPSRIHYYLNLKDAKGKEGYEDLLLAVGCMQEAEHQIKGAIAAVKRFNLKQTGRPSKQDRLYKQYEKIRKDYEQL